MTSARFLTLVGEVPRFSQDLRDGLLVGNRTSGRIPIRSVGELERELESPRVRLRIPGMSPVIVARDGMVWAHGFRMANRDRTIRAGPDTIYHLASLTKPYGSAVVLQLVQEGRVSLDDPVSRFGISMERTAPVRVWHLLSHTTREPPGTRYRYDARASAS